jgi:3-isopropylmalate/(R)-2-methylmalate dehydratase small subunit
MNREPFRPLQCGVVRLVRDDIDTDQIIPARFLTTTSRTGLGRHLFADWRDDEHGVPRRDFPLNGAGAAGARVLVAGRNFGCGSSREHAPWALLDWGFRAVVATSFGDIFRSNAHKNGLLTVALDDAMHAALLRALDAVASPVVHVDLVAERISASPGFAAPFEIDAFSRRCLLDGTDELGYLLAESASIAAFERAMPFLVPTTLGGAAKGGA